ncbi:MAG: PAS domain S-box protein, partial [Deltaproteobacteria bacterium]|nr:PAS domain S-box protein [Deltaproteobacteria bacterium]
FHGCTRDALRGKRVEEVCTLSRTEARRELEAARSGERTEFWFQCRRANGELRDVELHPSPIVGDGRELLYCIVHDVTDRRQAEEGLRESERKYRNLVELAQEGIWAIDADAATTFVNPRMAAILGYEPEEMLGRSLFSFMDEEHAREALRRAQEQRDRVPEQHDFEFLRKDGTHVSTVVAVSLFFDDGGSFAGAMGVVSDVTERRRAEEQRAALEARLRHVQKMEALGTLAGGIAHDFNNILTPIMAHAELSLLLLGDDHPVRENLRSLLDSAQRARDLVRQILAMTRRDADGPTEPVSLGLVVKEVAKLMRASLPANVEVLADVDPECGAVLGDVSQLHQVLLNLCTNAGYAMQERGGVLAVRLARATDDRGRPQVRLTVRDTGEGISPDVVGRIFEPYFTTKPVGKGSGLGLAVAHGIVTKLDGEIRVESEVGKGTIFEVLLPEFAPKAPEEAPQDEEMPKGGGKRVLVVDDEPSLRTVLGALLAVLDYRVVEAPGAAQALAAFGADPRGIDLVLTDYNMPGMNGLELAAELLRLRPDLPVVIGTGFAEAVTEKGAAERGLRGVILKPYTLRKMAQTLRQALLPPAV